GRKPSRSDLLASRKRSSLAILSRWRFTYAARVSLSMIPTRCPVASSATGTYRNGASVPLSSRRAERPRTVAEGFRNRFLLLNRTKHADLRQIAFHLPLIPFGRKRSRVKEQVKIVEALLDETLHLDSELPSLRTAESRRDAFFVDEVFGSSLERCHVESES